jgi:hypothetical protein
VGTLYGDDQLGNYWEDLVSTLVQQVVGAQDRERSVGVVLLSGTVEEDRKVVVVIERLH